MAPEPTSQSRGADTDRPHIDLIAACLRADLDDIAAFVEGLASKLEQALPGRTHVQRVRRGFRGPKLVQSIAVDADGDRLELHRDPGEGASAVQTLRAKVSGGIVLRTETIGIDEWLSVLTAAVASEAARSALTRRALEGLLLSGGQPG
jgi:hypothetical protein